MPPVDPTLQQTFAENVWLHFFQMGHSSSTSARPTILVRGEGSRVWDQDGNAYIDALAGLFCVNAGYGRREIVEAVAAQMLDIPFVSPFSFPNLPQIKLAGELAKISPMGPHTRSFFVTGGSEAVETALKLAKSYQRNRGFGDRHKTISRRVAYHGTTMGALSVNGLTGVRNGFGPLVPGARHVPLPHRYRCDYCALAAQCSGICADEIERLIEFEGPETIAAIIMEPVQNSGGAIVPPPGYLQRVRQICDHYGILMIADEVICGFGRVGDWFGSSALGEHPNVGDIRGMGMFMALELVYDQRTKQPLEEPNLMGWLSDQFKRRGLICRADDRLDPVIQLAPPLNIPQADADQVVAIVADVIHALGRKMGTQPTMEAVKAPLAIAVGG